MKPFSYNNKGFTLIELMVVIAITGILATIAIPQFSTMITNTRLRGAAREIHSVLQQARLRAAKEQSYVVVDFDPDGDGNLAGNYISFVDDNGDFTLDAGETIVSDKTLPTGILLQSAAFGTGPVTYTCFNKNGFPSDTAMNDYSGSVDLANSNYTRTIGLTAAGSPNIQ